MAPKAPALHFCYYIEPVAEMPVLQRGIAREGGAGQAGARAEVFFLLVGAHDQIGPLSLEKFVRDSSQEGS